MSELIKKLSHEISDIRYSLEVTSIELLDRKVRVKTSYSSEVFDKVLVTSKLGDGVIKDNFYNDIMKQITTNPFITCVYEVENKDLATTYYKDHLGQKAKTQFFFSYKQDNRTILTAYSYGMINQELIANITNDIKRSNINIKQLITLRQWHIFPHLKSHNLTQDFYKIINAKESTSNIILIGSLISKPSIDNLYLSVKNSVRKLDKT